MGQTWGYQSYWRRCPSSGLQGIPWTSTGGYVGSKGLEVWALEGKWLEMSGRLPDVGEALAWG